MFLRNINQLSNMSSSSCSNFANFVENGKKIIGAGINYKEYLKINKLPSPEKPIIFLKPPSSYITEGQDIILPKGFKVNEEVELGVIIGKSCKHVKNKKEAFDCIAGYCLGLDLTATSELLVARKIGHPWSIGKGFDTACPVSKFIPKKDLPNPDNVDLWIKINKECRQIGNTNDMIFSVSDLICFISKYMTLEPNDLILTGTPPGMSEICCGDKIEAGIGDLVTVSFNVTSE